MATVRPATLADVPRVAEIHVAAWDAVYRGIMTDALIDAYTVERRHAQWTQQLTDRPSICRVVEDAGRVVGWCTFDTGRDTPADVGEVYAIYLDPTARRHGFGRSLWQAAAAALADAGCRRFCVLTLSANAAARRFYEAMGGRPDSGSPPDFQRGGVRLTQVRYWFEVVAGQDAT